MAYKKCPRCSLNYIDERDVLCKVCLEEVGKALKLNEEEEEYDICPVCGENIVKVSEKMCYQCRLEHENGDILEKDALDSDADDWDIDTPNGDDDVLSDDEKKEMEELGLQIEEDFYEDDTEYKEEDNKSRPRV